MPTKQKRKLAPMSNRGHETPEGLHWPSDEEPVTFYALTGVIGFTPDVMTSHEKTGLQQFAPGLKAQFDDHMHTLRLNPNVDSEARLISALDYLIETDCDLTGVYQGVTALTGLRRLTEEAGAPPFPAWPQLDADTLAHRVSELGIDVGDCIHYEQLTEKRQDVIDALLELVEQSADDDVAAVIE